MRKVLAEQVRLTADKETFVPIDDLPTKHEFFTYQELVNKSERNVVSHTIIEDYIDKNGQDYRSEDKENPVEELQDRTEDNTTLGRVAGK